MPRPRPARALTGAALTVLLTLPIVTGACSGGAPTERGETSATVARRHSPGLKQSSAVALETTLLTPAG